MNEGEVRESRGDSNSNSIGSDVKTRDTNASGVEAVSASKCGICMASFGDVSIGCGGCNSRYHSTRVCQGLPDSVIDIIKEYGGRGVIRVVDGNRRLDGSVSEQAVKQLFETVKSLFAAVANLTNNMKHMMETVGQSNGNPVNRTESEAHRLIREEVMEMEERERRGSLR